MTDIRGTLERHAGYTALIGMVSGAPGTRANNGSEGVGTMVQQDQAHRQMVTDSLKTIASVLQEVLSGRVTAFVVGVRDPKTVSRWASGEVTEIRDPDGEQRLRSAYMATQMLLDVCSPSTAKSWYLGMNPELEDFSTAEAIRDGKGRDAMGAARVFITNG